MLPGVERLPFGAYLLTQGRNVAQLLFAQRRDLAQDGDPACHLGETPCREEISQVVVVAVVAVGFAHHLRILRAVAFKGRREAPGHAVRTVDLLLQELCLLLGLVDERASLFDLAGQQPHALLVRRAPLLELGDLRLLVGNALLEVGDDALLLLDALVGLGRGREHAEQQRDGQK